jgi:nicotinamidase-related amidase
LSFFREQGAHRLFLTIGPNASDGSDLTPWRRLRNARMNASVGGNSYPKADSSGPRGILKDLGVRDDEIVLNKPTFGAFASTGIDQVLRSWDTRQLVVCGQATNVCVYLTAGEAADRGYECCVIDDACAAYSDALHIAFLQNFALLFGRVTDTTSVLAELESRASTKLETK